MSTIEIWKSLTTDGERIDFLTKRETVAVPISAEELGYNEAAFDKLATAAGMKKVWASFVTPTGIQGKRKGWIGNKFKHHYTSR